MANRTHLAVAITIVAVAACTPELVTPRHPDLVGWVVESSQTADYVFEKEPPRIISGTVALTFESGRTIVVGAETSVSDTCQDLYSQPVEAKPCYLFVGVDAGGTAEWITAFSVDGWRIQNDAVSPDPIFITDLDQLTVSRSSSDIDHVTNTHFVMRDGPALAYDAQTYEVDCRPGATLTEMLAEDPRPPLQLTLDQATGSVATVTCLGFDTVANPFIPMVWIAVGLIVAVLGIRLGGRWVRRRFGQGVA